jgi:hypothetical protein
MVDEDITMISDSSDNEYIDSENSLDLGKKEHTNNRGRK